MTLERRAAMATLLADRGDDLLVIPGLGSTAWDAAAAGDNDQNFYLSGRHGRRCHDRSGPCAGPAEPADCRDNG